MDELNTHSVNRRRITPTALAWLGLCVMLAARLLIQALLYSKGFIALSADEFGRTILAGNWSLAPKLIWSGVWLPLDRYLLGIVLHFWWDLLWAPRLVVITFGLASILIMYLLGATLFKSKLIGLIAAGLIAANPAHLWLSATPLTEILFTTFILFTLYTFVRYLDAGNLRVLFFGSIALLLANSVRYEAWMVSLAFSLFLVITEGWKRFRGRSTNTHLVQVVLIACLPWLFPLAWMAGTYLEWGNPLYYVSLIKSGKLIRYGSENSSYIHYLRTLLYIDPWAALFGLLSLIMSLVICRRNLAVWGYFILAFTPFLLFILLHGGQFEPQGNYIRYLAPFIFLIYPLMAFSMVWLLKKLFRSTFGRNFALAVILLILISSSLWRAFHFVNDPAALGVAVGQKIKELRNERPAIRNKPMLVELSYWQNLAIQVGASDLSHILFDRSLDDRPMNAGPLAVDPLEGESIFTGGRGAFLQYINKHDISIVVVKSPEYRSAIEDYLGAQPRWIVNDYSIYRVPNNLTYP